MIIVKEGTIDEILEVHANIPEFIETKAEKEYFANRFTGKENIVLCAYKEKKVVGYLIGYDKFEDGSFYCWMAGVIPEFRKHGALTELMDYLTKWAKYREYNKIKIKTRNDKRDMLKFLIKNDFYFTGVKECENIRDNRINLEKNI